MNIIGRNVTEHHARTDAERGVDAKDRRITAAIGLSPLEAARGSYIYREAMQRAADTGRLEELREDLRRGEDLQALVGTPGRFTLGLVIVWMIEGAGSLLILRALGVPASQRPLPALALTLAMIGLTKVTVAATANRTPPPPTAEGDGGAPPAAATVRIDWRRYLVPLVFGAMVAAVAATRVAGSDAGDLSPIALWAEAALMVAITCGPAFAATWLEGMRRPALELARQIGLVRRRIRGEQREIDRARRHVFQVDRAQLLWTDDNARRRAAYSTAHETATAVNRLAR